MGGNPAQALASATALGSPAAAAAIAKEFGLTNPNLGYQYVQYLWQLIHGNLGLSYEYYPASVAHILLQALPYTVALVLTATIISFLVGWTLGVISAWRQGSAWDQVAVGVSFWLYALPYFWLAMLLVFVFAFELGWFPMAHALPSSITGLTWWQWIGGAVQHGILPVASLVLTSTAGHLLIMRNNMLNVLGEDYMLLARAKGLAPGTLIVRYAARAALLPSFTGLMLSLGTVVGGALVTEIVFSYPGIGLATYNAILSHDYPMIQGAFLLLAVFVIAANLVADLVYPLLDPRVQLQ
jgi:peptide/nickel transport system permease protein